VRGWITGELVGVNSSPRRVSVQRSPSGIVTLIARALTSGATSLLMAAYSHASRRRVVGGWLAIRPSVRYGRYRR
jgi:hypothetical protein